jgi:hypothetical protein
MFPAHTTGDQKHLQEKVEVGSHCGRDGVLVEERCRVGTLFSMSGDAGWPLQVYILRDITKENTHHIDVPGSGV